VWLDAEKMEKVAGKLFAAAQQASSNSSTTLVSNSSLRSSDELGLTPLPPDILAVEAPNAFWRKLKVNTNKNKNKNKKQHGW
jgi:hypothetical protein